MNARTAAPKGVRTEGREAGGSPVRAVVFIGPSLSLVDARTMCADDDAIDWRAPARMGDVYRAALRKPDVILVIDGYFEQVPSVWHKEVLFAISQGVPVWGASSMGALRAAELHAFGMRGIGRIFEAYASGAINDDDEVAIVHGQGDGRFALASEAMVNLRFALADARTEGLIDRALQEQLTELAKARFYPQRSWDGLWQDAAAAGIPDAALDALRRHVTLVRPNQKRDDAATALRALCAHLADLKSADPQPAATPDFSFEHTLYWETVENYFRHAAAPAQGEAVDAAEATTERLRNHVRLFDPERDRTLERALLFALVEQEAKRLRVGQRGSPSDDATALRRFRQRRGLLGRQALATWMAQQQLDTDACLQLARAEQRLREIAMRQVVQVDAWLEPVLKAEGRWHQRVVEVRSKWHALKAQGIHGASNADVGDPDAVLAWYQQRHGVVDGDLQTHLAERGFASERHFLDELFAEFLTQAPASSQAAA